MLHCRDVSITSFGEMSRCQGLAMVDLQTLARFCPRHSSRLAVWLARGVTMRTRKTFAAMSLGLAALAPELAAADEGGVSFWLPGIYGSLAATPLQPGWSGAVIYYHD